MCDKFAKKKSDMQQNIYYFAVVCIFVQFFFVSLKSFFSFLKSLFSRLKSLFRFPMFFIRKDRIAALQRYIYCIGYFS